MRAVAGTGTRCTMIKLNELLRLERPLAILDVETTGLDPRQDRVIQLGIKMHYPDKDPVAWKSYINPERPIINTQHGITDEHIQGCNRCSSPKKTHPREDCSDHVANPTFAQLAPSLSRKLLEIDICAYNGEFDVSFIKEEMKRSNVEWSWKGHIVDPFIIYKAKRGHTLTNCFLEYGGPGGWPLPPDTEVTGAHDAGNDVEMTEVALRGQLLRYENLPRSVQELSEFCYPHPVNAVDRKGKFVWLNGVAAFNFGKWRGRLITDPEVRGYLKWMASEIREDDVREICENALKGIYPQP